MRVERELAVRETTLERLQAVARPHPSAKVHRHPELLGEVDHGRDQVLRRRGPEVRVPGAAEVVVQDAVAQHRDGARRVSGVGSANQKQPRLVAGQHAVPVVGPVPIPLLGLEAIHRLVVDLPICATLVLVGLRAGYALDAVPVALVAPDLLAIAHPGLSIGAGIGDLDARALGSPGHERLCAQPLSQEDAHQPGARPVDFCRVEPHPALDGRSRIAVGRDRVDELRARYPARDDRDRDRTAAGRDPQRVRDPLGVVEGPAAEEVPRLRHRAPIGDQLSARPHPPSSKSSGRRPHISQSRSLSPRRTWERINPSRLKPRLSKARREASLQVRIRA